MVISLLANRVSIFGSKLYNWLFLASRFNSSSKLIYKHLPTNCRQFPAFTKRTDITSDFHRFQAFDLRWWFNCRTDIHRYNQIFADHSVRCSPINRHSPITSDCHRFQAAYLRWLFTGRTYIHRSYPIFADHCIRCFRINSDHIWFANLFRSNWHSPIIISDIRRSFWLNRHSPLFADHIRFSSVKSDIHRSTRHSPITSDDNYVSI